MTFVFLSCSFSVYDLVGNRGKKNNFNSVVYPVCLTVTFWPIFFFFSSFFQTSSDGNSTTSVLTFVPVKPTSSRYRNVGEGDEHKTADYDGRLTCRAENPQHQQQSTSQRKHIIAAGGSDSSDDAGTPFIQITWLLRIQCKHNNNIVLSKLLFYLHAWVALCFARHGTSVNTRVYK